jgi:hypothetical protein
MKRSINLALLVLAGTLGLTACGGRSASGDGGPDGADTMRGYLIVGGELYAFEACGTTNLVWADLIGSSPSGAEVTRFVPSCLFDAGTTPCSATFYYAELEGTIASGGGYGHAGKFSQQLTINRYLAASPTGPDDCPFLEPVYPF